MFTNEGKEFFGNFQALSKQVPIDQHTMSSDHLEVDGLAQKKKVKQLKKVSKNMSLS
jgi:hypothetical protein